MDRQFVFSLGIGNLVRELNGEVRRIAGNASGPASREIRRVEGKRTVSA